MREDRRGYPGIPPGAAGADRLHEDRGSRRGPYQGSLPGDRGHPGRPGPDEGGPAGLRPLEERGDRAPVRRGYRRAAVHDAGQHVRHRRGGGRAYHRGQRRVFDRKGGRRPWRGADRYLPPQKAAPGSVDAGNRAVRQARAPGR